MRSYTLLSTTTFERQLKYTIIYSSPISGKITTIVKFLTKTLRLQHILNACACYMVVSTPMPCCRTSHMYKTFISLQLTILS